MPAKFYNLDRNTNLGGENASDIVVSSQKAIKSYVDTQLATKQGEITGAASSITEDDLDADKVVISDNEGKLAESTVTTTELTYLAGATGNVQTQIDNKADSEHTQASNTINELTGYSKGTISGNLSTSDTLNEALSKLENNIDGKADVSDVTLVTIKDWTV